jgi:uncharacterized protein
MDLTHRFSVAAPLDQIWAAFNQIEVIAPCFPGASITSADGDKFAGTIKVKFGPASMAYSGYGSYLKRDERCRQLVVEAKGLDRRGRGTANAVVTATFSAAHNTTDVEVLTDLTLTGRPAQFGQSVIADISDRLLEQFVSNLAVQVAEQGAHWGHPDGQSPESAARGLAAQTAAGGGVGARGAAAGDPGTRAAAAGDPGTRAAGAGDPAARAAALGAEPAAPRRAGWRFTPPSNRSHTDLDVLRTLSPILLRRLVPLLTGVSVFWLLVRGLRRARRRS